MKSLSVKVPDHVFAEVAAVAKRRKVTKSQVIRERISPLSAEPSPAVDGRSLWDRMSHLALTDMTLPEDLSTNPAYLEDYGKMRVDRLRATRRGA